MSQTPLHKIFEKYHVACNEALEGMTEAELNWRSSDDINPIGATLVQRTLYRLSGNA